MQNVTILDTSCLTTEEDYINFVFDEHKFYRKHDNRIIFKILGILFVCVGVGTYFFIGGSLYQRIGWFALALIGLYLLFYYDVIDVYLTRLTAKKIYVRNKKNFSAKQMTLTTENIRIISENYEGNIPLKYIYKIVEGKNTLIFYLDKKHSHFIPKRALSDEQIQLFENFVKDLPEKKYKKL